MKDVEVCYDIFKFQDILDLNVLDLTLLKRGALLAQNPDNLAKPASPESKPTTNSNLPTAEKKPVVSNEQITPIVGNLDNEAELAQSNDQPRTNFNLLSTEARTLTSFEAAALQREEAATLNSLPKDLVVILATCANGALVQ